MPNLAKIFDFRRNQVPVNNLALATKFFKKAINKIFPKKLKVKTKPIKNLIKVGSKYGGWVVPPGILNNESICYCVGAGEDISFDVGLINLFQATVHIFDPTPRAKIHFNTLVDRVNKGEKFEINNIPDEFYDLDISKLDNLHFHQIGLWKEEKMVRFYEPKNKKHVSHSIVNLQQTQEYFEAKVNRLSNVMRDLGHDQIDLLKIDIEGAEYEVIKSIVEDKVNIKIICIEFDEVNNALDTAYLDRIYSGIADIVGLGYYVYHVDKQNNCYFMQTRLYDQIA